METDRRRLLIQACRQRQEQIKAKLKVLRQKMSGKSSPRGQQLERELLLRYHQEGQRIQRLLAESQESVATPARPAPAEESSPPPDLQKELSQSLQQVDKLRAELDRLQQKLDQAEAEVQRLSQEHGALTHLASHRAQQVERLQQEVDDLVQEVAQSHQHSQESFLEVQEARQLLEHAQQQIEQLRAQHQAELSGWQEKSQTEIDRLTWELFQLREELARATPTGTDGPEQAAAAQGHLSVTQANTGEATGLEVGLQEPVSVPQSLVPETVEFLAVDDLEAEGELSEFTSIEADSPPDWLLSDHLPDN